jgi:cell division protein FtsB
MNTFLKSNKNFKSQKATVILLSLFLIFFVSSIIGIIYSYNKRIFQLAKQERDNYKVFKKQFDEMFANLYMVDLI